MHATNFSAFLIMLIKLYSLNCLYRVKHTKIKENYKSANEIHARTWKTHGKKVRTMIYLTNGYVMECIWNEYNQDKNLSLSLSLLTYPHKISKIFYSIEFLCWMYFDKKVNI